MTVIALDFETRSRVDLKLCGTDNYAKDESTEIICCSFVDKSVNGQKWLWRPDIPMPLEEFSELKQALHQADEIEAHNARFDQIIYECIAVAFHGFPELAIDKWVCTAAQCRVNALPGSLDGATRAANAKHKKDHSGAKLIQQLCIPNKKTGHFTKNLKLLYRMGRYCEKDTLALVSLTETLRPLSPTDKLDWQVNERINDKGIMIDRTLATLAQQYADAEKKELGEKLLKLTHGTIDKVTQTARLLKELRVEWANVPRLMNAIKKPFVEDEEQKYTLDKAARGALLELPELDNYYKEVITLIDNGGNSSVSKFSAMLNRADPVTDRVHGAFIFAGAGQTQRFSSKGLQFQNMRRDCYNAEDTEYYKECMEDGLDLGLVADLPVMDALAKLLRPAIIPAPGCKFVVGDWSAIEARVLPWLADSEGGEEVLDLFRNDEDVYMHTAESMGLDDRQLGKVANLSLGFGGASGAFSAMAKNYGLKLSPSEISSVVQKWRQANPWARKFWNALSTAARNAVQDPRVPYSAGRIRYIYLDLLLGGTLMAILPDDTVIQYPYAKINEDDELTAIKGSLNPKADSEEDWPRMRLWGGFLAENVTQATAACLLKSALRELVADDFPVIGHAHDEIILESNIVDVEQDLLDLQDIMELAPEWAKGLPLKAIPAVFERYGK